MEFPKDFGLLQNLGYILEEGRRGVTPYINNSKGTFVALYCDGIFFQSSPLKTNLEGVLEQIKLINLAKEHGLTYGYSESSKTKEGDEERARELIREIAQHVEPTS